MKASGVYWTLTDESFKVTGSSRMVGIVAMTTLKGDTQNLNLVTASDFEDIVGYDLAYNGNYLGLKKMLDAVSYLYVMRINKNPYVSNIYDTGGSTTHDIWTIGSDFYNSDLSAGTEPAGTAGTPVSIGNVYIATAADTALENGVWYTKSDTTWYKVAALTTSALTLGAEVTDAEAIAALEAVTTSAVSYVVYTETASITSYEELEAGASLEELAATVAFQLNFAGNDGHHYVKVLPQATTVSIDEIPAPVTDQYTFDFASAIDISKACVPYAGSNYAFVLYDSGEETVLGVAGTDGKVYAVVNDAVTTTQIGTVSNTSAVLDATKVTFSGGTCAYAANVPALKLFTLYHAYSKIGDMNKLSVQSVKFSLLSSSDYYYEKLDFGELIPTFKTNPNFDLFSDYVELLSGSNGTTPNASDVDFTAFNKSPANICVLPGQTNVGLINAFAQQSERGLKSLFVGAPELSKYFAVESWASALYNTEYMQLAWVSDIEETDVGPIYISPAVNLFLIYAQMMSDYGNLKYPPAGYAYGNIAVTQLMETDYNLFRDELKTNRINYQMIGPRGPVMWEQRTRYGSESDLSYANTVFILRDLRESIITYAANYNFIYTSPSMLTTFGKGLDTILRNEKQAGFLSTYSLAMPTFAEAQAAGRTLTIRIGVAITQDSEEIYFDVKLQNFSDVAA